MERIAWTTIIAHLTHNLPFHNMLPRTPNFQSLLEEDPRYKALKEKTPEILDTLLAIVQTEKHLKKMKDHFSFLTGQ